MKLVKVSNNKTIYKLYVYNKLSKKEEIRYYDTMFDLFSAYRQLYLLNCNLIPLRIEYE